MPNLTLTPDPGTGSNRLTLATPNTITRIQRTDANGTADVRVLPGQLPHAPALVETVRNLIPNPSCETNITGWNAARGSVVPYQFTGTSWNGNQSGPNGMRFTADGTAGGAYVFSPNIPVTAGTAVAVAAVASSAVSGARWRLSLLFYRADGSSTALHHGGPSNAGASVYALTHASIGGVAPADTTFCRLLVYSLDSAGGTTPPAGAIVYMDTFMAVAGPDLAAALAAVGPGTYFDGSTHKTGTAAGVTAWTGTAHASASTYSVAAAPLILDDYEAASGSATYTVTSTYGDETAGTTLALSTPRLGTPVTPQFSAAVPAVTSYGAGMDSRATVLEPPGSPFPLVISRSSSSRRGTLGLHAGNYPAALELLRLTGRGQVLMLRQPDHAGMDMYFIPTRAVITTLANAGPATLFRVDVDFLETSRPGGDLAGALGWTWEALRNTYTTWGAAYSAYATWGDLRTNKKKA